MAEVGSDISEVGKDMLPPKDRGDVLHRLLDLKGDPLDPPLTSRILSNTRINTVIVFSGEAGGGKSVILGQLDKELAASSVRRHYVFTEDALSQTEEELERHRSEWDKQDYELMTRNLLSMILAEKERMRTEATDQRSVLLVETMALPAADGLDRGQTALMQLEQTQGVNGIYDTFYIGLPANPAIQERANIVRDSARNTTPGDIIDLLARNNISVSGVESIDTEEIAIAIKDALARQATRSRLELVGNAVRIEAMRWIRDHGMQEGVPHGEKLDEFSEEYRIKAAYMEHVLRNIYRVPPERGVVALSPFDPELHIEWNVAPFLRTGEESNSYPIAQKEVVLCAARDVLVDPEGVRSILGQEALAIARGLTTSDFLEILSGPQLVACLKIMRDALQTDPTAFPKPPSIEQDLSYESQRRGRFKGALQNMRNKLQTSGQNPQTEDFLSSQNRKAFGMASTSQDIIDLADTIEAANNAGLIPSDNNLVLVNMFGTFDPFVHAGHVGLADQVYIEIAEGDIEPRIVTSTFATNSQKSATKLTFPARLDNLYRAMLERSNITVLGIPGNFSDTQRRREQLELLASFDKDHKLRRACGSDVFEGQLNRAKEGDSLSQSSFRLTDILYVIPRRGGYNKSRFERQLKDARSMYPATEIVVLKEIGISDSGTDLRRMEPEQRAKHAPNRHIRLVI